MIFGYGWNDPRAIKQATQRQYLVDAGANERQIRFEKSPGRDWRDRLLLGDKPLMRRDDVLAVYRTQYLANDALDFITVLCRLASIGCGLHVVNQGVTVFPDGAMTDLIEKDLAERRKKQTETARAALSKMPIKQGRPKVEDGWSEDDKKKFRKLWAMDKTVVANRAIGREFEISAPAVVSVAERMKLPPRGD